MTARGHTAVRAAYAVIAAACGIGPIAFASTSYAAQDGPAHHQAATHAQPVREVRAVIVSGTPQSAHTYVAPAAAVYVTEFTHPLVVRLEGAKNPKVAVRFFCTTPKCELPPQVQPDEVKRIDPRTFEVPSKNGRAAFSATVSTDTPETVEVVAEPVAGPGERAVRSAPFHLTEE